MIQNSYKNCIDKKIELSLLALIDDLQIVEKKFQLGNRFNIFEAINMVKQEIRHTRFLAFLLNPAAPHGLGDRFLRSILMATTENHPHAPISRLTLATMDCNGALVYCERDNFDISIHIPDINLLFVIENKIGASESERQLESYRKKVASRYAQYKFMGSFLTPQGYDGADETWGSLSYQLITIELRRLISENIVSESILLSITHYIELIERNIMVPQELIDICRKIYSQHRTALELIIEHGQRPLLTEAFASFQEEISNLTVLTQRSNEVYFVPNAWLDIEGLQVADTQRWVTTCLIKLWFQTSDNKIFLRLEVGPVTKEKPAFNRIEFVKSLRKELNVGGRQSIGELFTRIYTYSSKLPEDPSEADICKAMKDLWKNLGGEEKVTNVANAANKSIGQALMINPAPHN